jgi:antirestriction protein ArdC
VLKSDAKAIFRASAQASRAVAYLEGLQPLMVRSANQNQAFGIPHQQREGKEE